MLALDSASIPACNSGVGSLFASASGGVPPYSFLWSNSINTAANVNIPAGTYTVTVTDSIGCSASEIYVLLQPAFLSDSSQIFAETCGNGNGAVTVFPIGGNAPYSYHWSSGETIATVFNKSSGNYIVTITDFNQCVLVDTIFIPEVFGAVISTDSVVNVLCNGQSTGAIYIFYRIIDHCNTIFPHLPFFIVISFYIAIQCHIHANHLFFIYLHATGD